MGQRGKETPKVIRDFVVRTNQPPTGLSQRQIADRVEKRFGEKSKIDKSTVGRILQKFGLMDTEAGERKPYEEDDWKSWVHGNVELATRATSAYIMELAAEIQRVQINKKLRATLMPPRIRFGPQEKIVVEGIRTRDRNLRCLEQSLHVALEIGNFELAQGLVSEIEKLLSGWIRI